MITAQINSILDSKNKTKSDLKPHTTGLRIIKLGSEVGATKNMTVYEYGNDIIVVDCGIGYPDSDLPGVDIVIPDTSYLLEHKDKVRAIFVTHGHEDHFGAIPFVIKDLNVPIYANKLVQGLIRKRLEDRNPEGAKNISFNTISADSAPIRLGAFSLEFFRVNHSVPDSLGFAIKTPEGTILHMADFKLDFSPVIDQPIELNRIAGYGDEGVLCLLSDCLGVTHPGYTQSERTLKASFDAMFEKAYGKQIFVTTISSNISRMYQVIESAIKSGRKVVFVGRSIIQTAEIAKGLKYLPFSPETFVDLKEVNKFDPTSLVYIIAGCFGQEGSALYKLSQGEHPQLTIQDGDLVIFAADPGPPSSHEPVETILHYLTVAGADVLYSEIQDNLHVSGHGKKGDLETVAALSKSKFYIPIGGTAARMRAYTHMVEELGVPRDDVFELLEGESVIFENGYAHKGEKVPTQNIYIDPTGQPSSGDVVIKDREKLSGDGVFVVIVPISKDKTKILGGTEVVTRGFFYVKENMSLLGRSKDVVNKVLDKEKDNIEDWNKVKNKIEKNLEKFFKEETGKKPLILISPIQIQV